MIKISKIVAYLLTVVCVVNLTASDSLLFPSNFLKGCSLSAFQNGGHYKNTTQSNWSIFHNKKRAKHLGGTPIGKSNDFYQHAFEDIQLLKAMGCNALRLSIEWADIEPVQGHFDHELLAFYKKFCKALVDNDITPMITLHHFVHPAWFENKGGWKKLENIGYFVRYAQIAFKELHEYVPFWCTINEPTVVSGCGYVLGIHAPGGLLQFNKAAHVLRNLLYAHVATYKALKTMHGGKQASIGLAHSMLLFNPYMHQKNVPLIGACGLYNPLSKILAHYMTSIFAHDTVMNFFRTGRFCYKLKGIKTLSSFMPDAAACLDFIGLNFYSEVVVGMTGPTHYPDQIMTDMEYPVWPAKMYEALKNVAQLGKPIYITENGMPDNTDDRRPEFIKTYLKAVHKALIEKIDVRGYFHWTLIDNFEWQECYTKKFGLYAVDFKDPCRVRTPKASSLVYRDFMKLAEH